MTNMNRRGFIGALAGLFGGAAALIITASSVLGSAELKHLL